MASRDNLDTMVQKAFVEEWGPHPPARVTLKVQEASSNSPFTAAASALLGRALARRTLSACSHACSDTVNPIKGRFMRCGTIHAQALHYASASGRFTKIGTEALS